MAMSREEVFAKILEITEKEGLKDKNGNPITEQTHFVVDCNADSLDTVEIGMEIEDQFGLPSITDEEAAKLTTVGAVVEYVLARQSVADEPAKA